MLQNSDIYCNIIFWTAGVHAEIPIAMNHSSTSHRPWEAADASTRTPPGQAQQTLPSITTLTANMSSACPDQPPLNLSMSALQRDSGAWSVPASTRKYSPFFFLPSAPFQSHCWLRDYYSHNYRFFGLFGKHDALSQFITAFSEQALWLR